MKIHEYQAKELFHEFGIPATRDAVASTPAEAVAIAERMGLPVVLKAQVHTGGRGKAGGVKVVRTRDEAARAAESILALTIKGFPVRKISVVAAQDIRSEAYLSLLVDRGASRVVFIGCAEGGMEIEETAKTSPEKILRLEVGAGELAALPAERCLPFAAQLAGEEKAAEAVRMMQALARLFLARDCSLIEINPLVLTESGELLALDGKVIFDDNGLFRHPENAAMRDPDAEDEDEAAARRDQVTFVRLDGTIGCMVNGAGLAMATMDIIKHYGGAPANFLDAGGSSDPAKVLAGIRLLLKDPRVRSIFINIFGGITRCDDIARGILAAREQFEIPVPIVIRLVGTNAEEGRALVAGTDMTFAETLEEGARLAVQMGGAR